MDDLTDDEILAFRDLTEFMTACGQAALGVYGSGGDVPDDRQRGARANVASWLAKNPALREELKSYIQRNKEERERYARGSKHR